MNFLSFITSETTYEYQNQVKSYCSLHPSVSQEVDYVQHCIRVHLHGSACFLTYQARFFLKSHPLTTISFLSLAYFMVFAIVRVLRAQTGTIVIYRLLLVCYGQSFQSIKAETRRVVYDLLSMSSLLTAAKCKYC